MKVVRENECYWKIVTGDRQVAHISKPLYGLSRDKSLYIKNKYICYVKNQVQAIERLEEFLIQNQKMIQKHNTDLEHLMVGLTQVEHEICREVISKEIDVVKNKIMKLEELENPMYEL